MLAFRGLARGKGLKWHVALAQYDQAVRCFSSHETANYRTIRAEIEDAAGVITICRPRALNAVNSLVCDLEFLHPACHEKWTPIVVEAALKCTEHHATHLLHKGTVQIGDFEVMPAGHGGDSACRTCNGQEPCCEGSHHYW